MWKTLNKNGRRSAWKIPLPIETGNGQAGNKCLGLWVGELSGWQVAFRSTFAWLFQIHSEIDELHSHLQARRGSYGTSLPAAKMTAQAFNQFEKTVEVGALPSRA